MTVAYLSGSAGVSRINQTQLVVRIHRVPDSRLDIRCLNSQFLPSQKTIRSRGILGRRDRLFVVHFFASHHRDKGKH